MDIKIEHEGGFVIKKPAGQVTLTKKEAFEVFHLLKGFLKSQRLLGDTPDE